VRVNRAFALARARGAESGLLLLDKAHFPGIDRYPYVHIVRGTLLAELGRAPEARASFELALDHARNSHERAQIEEQMRKL
jgi:RNA polymerase sigma-70 factor (ECF subfamily)